MRVLILLTTFIGFAHSLLGMSLAECQKTVLQNNEKITIAELQILIEKDRQREIEGYSYPQISGELDYRFKGEAKHIHREKGVASGRASLVIPIVDLGGRNYIKAQKKLYEASLINSEQITQELLYLATQAYFQLLEAEKYQDIVAQSIQLLEEQLKLTQDFFSQGLIQSNELLLVEVELGQLNQDYIQAQNYVCLAKGQLNRLMGNDLDHSIEIDDVLDETLWTGNLPELLDFAKNMHPELNILCAKIAAAEYAIKGEKAQNYPTANFFTTYSSTSDYAFPYTHGLEAGIGVKIPVYNGGITSAKVSRLKKELCELQEQYQALEKDIELKIRSAFLNIQSSLAQLPLAEKNIRLAEENLSLIQDHFAEGLVTNIDVINDEARLFKARVNYYKALYQFHVAKANLAYSAGKLAITEGYLP